MASDAREYIAKLPKERREEIRKRADELIAEELTLRELREARQRSQVEVAQILGIKQAAVSKLAGRQRTAVVLHQLEDQTYNEVAEQMARRDPLRPLGAEPRGGERDPARLREGEAFGRHGDERIGIMSERPRILCPVPSSARSLTCILTKEQ